MFYVFLVLVLALDVTILEFSKNNVLGILVSILIAVGFAIFFKRVLPERSGWLKLASWAGLIVLLFIVGKISTPPIKEVKAFTHKNPMVTEVVEVSQGKLTGVYNEEQSVELYAGIPFAAPPVGDLRWAPPQDPESWEGVKACDTFAPMAMQSRSNVLFSTLTDIAVFHTYHFSLTDNYLEPMSEDCLYLNIWKPAGEVENAPVLFFIHGGSLRSGQTWYSEYNGEDLAKQGIIVVNCAYRLGVFGYYANEELQEETKGAFGETGTTGNYGLLDQIKALQWVHDNIAAFGGNPEEITIAGESAGSSSVGGICVSPLAKGLFKRAIGESSGITPKVPYHTFRTIEQALLVGNKIEEEFEVSSVKDLRKIDAKKILGTKYDNTSMTVDGYAIVEQPYLTYEKGNNNEEAFLNGFNVHEADLFALTYKVTKENYVSMLERIVGDGAEEVAAMFPPEPVDPNYKVIIEAGADAKGSYNKILSACWFTYSHYDWSRYLTAQGKPVYMYHFTKDNKALGSNHAGEMPYFYGNLWRHEGLYDASDEALSKTMMAYYVNFIKTGDPNSQDGSLPEWTLFDPALSNVMELGANVGMITDPFSPIYPYIDRFQEQLVNAPKE